MNIKFWSSTYKTSGILIIVIGIFITAILYTNVSRTYIHYHISSLLMPQGPKNQSFVNTSNALPSKDSSKPMIDIETLIKNGFPQNDSRMIAYIRKHHLIPPSTLPYKLNDPNDDPGTGQYYNGQNIPVKKILNNMRNGYFVDAGAHDGEFISNTLDLERTYNWTGLLVEPSPIELKNLKAKNRKAWIADVCLSPTSVPSTFTYLHRIGYTIASKLRSPTDQISKDWKAYTLQCFPLFSLLSALDVKTVDYFSLDVEGIELKVLNTIPFESIFIKVFSIEWNLIPEGKEALTAFMKTKGYHVAAAVYHDLIFAHDSLKYNRTLLATTTKKPEYNKTLLATTTKTSKFNKTLLATTTKTPI